MRTPEEEAEYAAYLASPAWRARRSAAMARAGYVCEFVTPYESRPDRDWGTHATPRRSTAII